MRSMGARSDEPRRYMRTQAIHGVKSLRPGQRTQPNFQSQPTQKFVVDCAAWGETAGEPCPKTAMDCNLLQSSRVSGLSARTTEPLQPPFRAERAAGSRPSRETVTTVDRRSLPHGLARVGPARTPFNITLAEHGHITPPSRMERPSRQRCREVPYCACVRHRLCVRGLRGLPLAGRGRGDH